MSTVPSLNQHFHAGKIPLSFVTAKMQYETKSSRCFTQVRISLALSFLTWLLTRATFSLTFSPSSSFISSILSRVEASCALLKIKKRKRTSARRYHNYLFVLGVQVLLHLLLLLGLPSPLLQKKFLRVLYLQIVNVLLFLGAERGFRE